MFSLLKDLLSIPVISTIILAVLAAIFRKYISFSRRDFFSRPPLEQVEAIKWLRKSTIPSSDPLALAEQQFLFNHLVYTETGNCPIDSFHFTPVIRRHISRL